ncbi:MAG: hypothetical protein ABIX28_25645 [Vicinamibacterales bacterium]
MVIKASAAAEIRLLVDALSGADDVARESAAARLRVIGPRAIERLLGAYDKARAATARATLLRVLEPIADGRCVGPARDALTTGDADLASAGAALLRGLVDAADPRVANDALEALIAVALDESGPPDARRSAAEVLRDLPAVMRAGILGALGPADAAAPVPEVTPPLAADQRAEVWRAALDGQLPERPSALREALTAHAPDASLSELQKLVDAIRTQEAAAGGPAPEWLVLRGAVHQVLASRGSRIALYDLRETLERSSSPLPVSFLSALHTIGDRACLEPLAEACAHAPAREAWWRQQLTSAFRAIMTREQLTVRSALVKKIVAKWPGIVA